MTPSDAIYGRSIRQYRGTGTLQHHPLIDPAPCTFTVYQLQDGDIRLRCETALHEGARHLRLGPQANLHLEGTTEEGQPLRIDGPALNYSSRISVHSNRPPDPVVIHYHIHGTSRVQVGVPAWTGEATTRFALVDFRFLGTEAEEIAPGHSALNLLRLNVADTSITIRKVQDYETRLERLEELGGSDITCEAEVTAYSPNDLPAVQQIMDYVCQLLSIASGTLVSWLYFEILAGEGIWLYTEHRNAITRDFVTQPLIDPRQMDDVRRFVESSYDRHVELTATHRMTQVVHAFTEIRSNNFLGTRGLALVSLVDYLTSVLAGSMGKSTLVPPTLHEQGKDNFKTEVAKAARSAYPGIDKDTCATLVKQCLGNYQTFRRKLKLFCREYRVPISTAEIQRFIENRNDLTHRAAFRTSEDYGELSGMMHVLDRMILRLLNYSGPYMNCMTWEREELHPRNDAKPR